MSDVTGDADVEVERPSAARVFDYFLGGSHNYAVDRELAHRLQSVLPDVGRLMWAHRSFSHRAVRLLASAGVRQFLELGAGLPTAGSVHEAARRHVPDARVVYVDCDPVAVARGAEILKDDPAAAVVGADLRDHAAVLADPLVRKLIDLRRPLGVLLVSVLQELPGDEPARAIAGYREVMAEGSFLVLSHATRAGRPAQAEPFKDLFDRGYGPGTDLTFRSRGEVEALFAGFEIVEPGVVYLAEWRPDGGAVAPHPESLPAYGAVGRLGRG